MDLGYKRFSTVVPGYRAKLYEQTVCETGLKGRVGLRLKEIAKTAHSFRDGQHAVIGSMDG